MSNVTPARPGCHLRERILDPLRDLECVRLRELLDDEHEPGARVRVADERLVILDHGRDFAQGQVGALDAHLREVVGALDRRDVLDAEPLVVGVDEASGAWRGRLHEGER